MTRFEDRVDAHPIVVAIEEALAEAERVEAASPDIDLATRPAQVLRTIAHAFHTTDKTLLTPGLLDPPAGPLISMTGYLRTFAESGDVAQLEAANNTLDDVLRAVSQWPLALTLPAEQRNPVAELEATAQRAMAAANELVGQLRSRVEQSLSETASHTADVDSAVAGLGARVEELGGSVDAQKARLDAAIAEYQSQFSTSQEERRRQNEELVRQLGTDIQSVIAAAETKTTELSERLEHDALAILTQIEDYRLQAVKVTEAIGIAGMAEGFRGDADAQRGTANGLRWGALGALGVAAVLAIWAAAGSGPRGTFDIGRFVGRSVAAGAVASIAAYLIVQSAHHRQRERQSRRQALELASIDPYLALMPDDVRVAVKSKLAETWFAQPLTPIDDEGGAHAASIPVAELVTLLVKLGGR